MKWFKIGIISLLTLFILTALFIETAPGKRLLVTILVKSLNRSGIQLKVGEVCGNFPQELNATDVRIAGLASIQKLHIELSILSLLGGELKINELIADNVQIIESQSKNGGIANRSEPKFPLAVNIRHYRLTHVQGPELPELALEGSGSMRRKSKSAYLEGTLTRYDVPDATVDFAISRNRLGKVEGDFTLSSPTLTVLKPWIQEDLGEGTLRIHAHTRGTPSAFTAKLDGKVRYDSTDWAFKTRVRKELNKPIELQKIVASTVGLRVSGSANLTLANTLDKATLQLRVDLNTLPLPMKIEGTLFARGTVVNTPCGLDTKASWESEQLVYDGIRLTEASGSLSGLIQKQCFTANVAAQANYRQALWTLSTPLIFRKEPENSITLEEFRLDSDLLAMQGNLSFVNHLWIGNVAFQRANLSLFEDALSGVAQGTVILLADNGEQQIQTNISASHLAYGPVSASSALLKTDGDVRSVELEHVKWKKIILDTAFVESSGTQFSVDGEGTLLRLNAEGQWNLKQITIERAEGRFLQHGFRLLAPTELAWGPNRFSWDRLYAAYGSGLIDGSYTQEKTTVDSQALLQKIPLNILSLNPMESRVEGTFDAKASLHKKEDVTEAEWTWNLAKGILENQVETIYFEETPPEPLTVAAFMEGKLHGDKLQLVTNVQVRDVPFLNLDLKTPLHVDSGWELSIPPGHPAGSLKAQGKLEDFVDFLDLGMHRVAGFVNCDLILSRGAVQGRCTIQDGYYQNYVTGTELSHIVAGLEGSGDSLVLKSLTAKDLQNNEVLSAKGLIHLSLKDLFPFHFDAKFDHLNVVQIDLVTATAEGTIAVDGNLQSALTTGSAQITRSDIAIPTHIPRTYPDLKVIYKHRPITPIVASTPKPPFPLHLDLKVEAPKSVFINGRGLTSEWNGDFTIGGSFAEPAVHGSLVLIDGEFSFAGKRFKLSNGSLSMQGNQYQLPLIDIMATTTEKAITITARLKGPLNRPQLTFQSVPPLPLSAILSHLLFGKDLSDVTGLQALQLAGTVASVAGEGPDILEITRKSLGVDRLQIVMTPTRTSEGYEGKETITLEVGKVLTPGIILTVKQSANDSNPDIGIEVDLTQGFVLEVESQQQPEQGKFSLKWNVNY
jgi:hypothetical protein